MSSGEINPAAMSIKQFFLSHFSICSLHIVNKTNEIYRTKDRMWMVKTKSQTAF
jgi:hypothetical protein